MWELISRALASLGPEAMAISSTQPDQPDRPLMPPETAEAEEEDPESLVEYEGMLVSASAAQRRRYTNTSALLWGNHALSLCKSDACGGLHREMFYI